MAKVILIQRFFANFREGLFDRLNDELDLSLISHHKGHKKIKVPVKIFNKPYFKKITSFKIYEDYVLFPFLFWNLVVSNPEIIITEGGKNTVNNLWVFMYSKLFKKEYIVWDLGKGYKKHKKIPFYLKPYFLFQQKFYYQAKKIYTYNKQGADYFNARFPNLETVILQNTVDTDKINNLIKVTANYPNDVPVDFRDKKLIVGYIGAINKKKNIEALSVLNGFNDLAIIVIGDGEPKYVDYIKSKFDNVKIAFVGYKSLEQLYDYYSIIDVIILPGLGGLTVPQSFAFGTSVIAVKADGIEKEIIDHGETGYILKDMDELPSVLNKHTKSEFNEMGSLGKVKVDKYYSIGNYCKQFKENL